MGRMIQPQEVGPVNQPIRILGIDIAKQVFHLVGMDGRGRSCCASGSIARS
jgi:hypothetical protein